MPQSAVAQKSFIFKVNPDLDTIDWDFVCTLFEQVNWRTRTADELKGAFSTGSWKLFVYHGDQLVGFGRTVDDGRYYAILADVIVDPEFQGNGLGKEIVNRLNSLLEEYHFVTLTAAPGKSKFYTSIGWKKQTTAYIWPQGPKQLRQHTEEE